MIQTSSGKVSGRSYLIDDITKSSSMKVEELEKLTNGQLVDIILAIEREKNAK